MGNRFINGRKLAIEYFDTGAELVNFVNCYSIESDDIQKIERLNGDSWALFYWE